MLTAFQISRKGMLQDSRRLACSTQTNIYLYLTFTTQKHCKMNFRVLKVSFAHFLNLVRIKVILISIKVYTYIYEKADQILSRAIYVQSWCPCFLQNTKVNALTTTLQVFAIIHCTLMHCSTVSNCKSKYISSYNSQPRCTATSSKTYNLHSCKSKTPYLLITESPAVLQHRPKLIQPAR